MILPNLSDEHPDLNVNLNFGEWLNGARALVNGINRNEDVKETSGSSSDVIDYVSAACDGLPTTTDDESRWLCSAKTNIGRRRLVRGRYHFTAGSAAYRFQQ